MAGSNFLLKIIILIIYLSTNLSWKYCLGARLNVPRVLLPIFADFPVNETLEVSEGGCYQWSTTPEDVVQLLPINENIDNTCSSGVVVQSVTRELIRKTAIVLAKDVETGQTLRCDVIVDAIHSLHLVTATRELFIEDAPEIFEVRAEDDRGNEFTTLAGIEFIWTIGNGDENSLEDFKDTDILKFISFQQSRYETPESISMFDTIGKKGHIILLEGIKTGKTNVSAKLPYSEYSNVPAVKIELTVVANLIIIPTDVTIMAHDTFVYKIMQVHQGRLEEIRLSSSQYILEVNHPDILEIDKRTGKSLALSHGTTKVSLKDKNINEEYGIVLPTATVHVNSVDYITITVAQNKNRELILGQTHEIIIELFDARDHKFHIGDNVDVSVQLNSEYFDKKMMTKNGTYLVVVPISCGKTLIQAKLHGIVNRKGRKTPLREPLVAEAELIIHTPVVLSPKRLIVPWDPLNKTPFDVVLKASGGDGVYMWSSRPSSVASVSQYGVVRILNQGESDITASMIRNPYNRDEAKIYAMLPSRLEVTQYTMEAAINEPIYLYVALYGKLNDSPDVKEIAFTDCRETAFEMYISESNIVRNMTNDFVPPIDKACTTLTVIGNEVGSTSITIAYRVNGKYLSDNVTVIIYKPLSLIYPENSKTLLAVGSSRKILFKGGPQPHSGNEINFIKEMSISKEEIVRVVEKKVGAEYGNAYIYEVTCKSLGDSVLTFKIMNEPHLPKARSNVASEMVFVTCGKPKYLILQPEFKDSKNCPIRNNVDKIMAHSDIPLRLLVIVKDKDGVIFDNITSLNIEWSLTPVGSGHFAITTGIIESTFTVMNYIFPQSHYQIVTPEKHTGSLKIHAKLSDYQKYILAKLGISPEWPPFSELNEKGNRVTPKINAELNIFLVNNTVITPNKVKLLNDPNAKYSLEVSQGSGHFEFILSTNDIADVRYIEPTKTISIIPKRAGILDITLVDLCLTSEPSKAEIEIQQLAIIEFNSINKVQKNNFISAEVKLYDTKGNIIELPSLESLNLKPEIDNGFIEVKQLPINKQGSSPYSKILYTIYGVAEGDTKLTFVSSYGKEEIRSVPNIIQVFMPLKVTQKNVTILIGTIYQIMTTGGPSNALIEFHVNDGNIVKIDDNGILEGKSIGNTKVVVKAVSSDLNGDKIIYSQDEVNICVTNLEGINIVTPTTRIKVGATIPLWAFGIPDHLTPLIIGSMKSLLAFTWYSSDSNMIHLHNMYEGTGINVRYQNEVTLRAKALKAGTVTVYLNVTIPPKSLSGYKEDVTFQTSIKIEIIEDLRIINPEFSMGMPIILMTPNSSLKIKTNRDSLGTNTYQIMVSGQPNEPNDSNALMTTKTITVDKSGKITSGDYGSATLTITNLENYNRKQGLLLKQTVAIEVKPIHYMMLSLSSNVRIREGEELNILPKGMEFKYNVDYFDNLGNKFHAGEMNFDILANRADLVSFTPGFSNQVVVKFKETGELVAKVFGEKYSNEIFDYVHMMIGDIIFPVKTVLTVGDIVCFSMPLLSSSTGDPGFWQSSNTDVLTVDAVTGIGKAKGLGYTVVKHSLTSHTQGNIDVNVQPISKISLVQLRGKNISGTEIFSVPLVLKSKDEGIKENNVLARGLGGCRTRSSFTLDSFPFTCTIQFASPVSTVNIKDILTIKPRFDIVTGFYYCDVIPFGIPTKASSILDTRIQVNAHSRDIQGKPLDFNYLPPIYVPSNDVIFTYILSENVATATIQLFGLQSVLDHITFKLPDGINLNICESVATNMLQCKLRLIQDKDDFSGQKIQIVNDLIHQNISLLIRLTKQDEFSHITGINWIDCLYFHRYTFVTFVIIVITVFYMWRNRITNVNLNVKNPTMFADKYANLSNQSSPGNMSSLNTTFNTSQPSPDNSIRPFSAFEPVYGDPRGFYSPNSRRNA